MPLTRRHTIASLAAIAGPLGAPLAAHARPQVTHLDIGSQPDTRDFEAVLQRGNLRLLVPYSRTLFTEDRGNFHGLLATGAEALEDWLRERYPAVRKTLIVSLHPVSRDRLLPDLIAGHGDIAAGEITVTPERESLVAFSIPTRVGVREIVLTQAGETPMAAPEDLSGRRIAACPGTTPYESVRALNDRLQTAGRAPAVLLDLPATLEAEDMMEMLSAGLLPAIPAETWMFEAWKRVIPGLMAHPSVVLRTDARLACAVRPGNPRLLEVLNAFLLSVSGSLDSLYSRERAIVQEVVHLHAATTPAELQKFNATLALFQRYAPEYGFDELMLLAQGYQESKLDQTLRSSAGAIGLMQLLPATGAAMKVGDIREPGPNVHAGAKYLRQLLDVYLSDASFDEQNRTLFAFACYNAGPNRIARLRREAEQEGLDPNLWFDHVERIAARRIGQETVRYVRNIYKYYIGYRLVLERRQTTDATRARFSPPQ
ncbi:Transporter substrate-binding domain-containing protein [Rhodovastum atsumiense]|uniref:Transporter substrate-binding domain-containing protein n=1 Tax=Rhodovastum atsumiense TaxID=504468 RepID=A0A5M6IY83_9PROT|nr:transporter substrate-binding domain-containing protein [Rhodovastum atsumiense]KAA5612919.1 transporter substrate-binding domain-containing protein [Rhodovastum atsumiense]CAH2600997.1 Transporter substrate-binding domain-containing protein [Rhodovastum atsumiense]